MTSHGFGINFIYLVAVLVPGWLGLKVYHWFRRSHDDHSRYDKLLWTAVIGVLTLVVPLAAYWCSSGSLSELCLDGPEITLRKLSMLPIRNWITAIGIQSVAAGVLGMGAGIVANHIGRSPTRSRADLSHPWDFAFDHRKQLQEVTVLTSQNERFKGRVRRYGSKREDYDLLLTGVRKLDEGGKPEKEQGYRYFSDDNIGQIHFHGASALNENVGRVRRLYLTAKILVGRLLSGTSSRVKTIISSAVKILKSGPGRIRGAFSAVISAVRNAHQEAVSGEPPTEQSHEEAETETETGKGS